MKIEIWSDVVCPWCYVGKRHLEQALRTFEHANEVEVEWKSYELDPTAPAVRPGTYVERADEALAMEIGVQGVSFFVFDRRFAVSGAQPPELLLEVLERTRREANPIETVAAGDLCEGDACEL